MDKAQDLTRTYKFTKIDIDIEQGRINFQKNEISSMQLLFFKMILLHSSKRLIIRNTLTSPSSYIFLIFGKS